MSFRLKNVVIDSHEIGGLLFGRLESPYGCAEWANQKELDGNSEPVGRQ